MNFFRRLSIRTKLLAIMLMAGGPVVLTLCYHLYTSYHDDYREAEHAALLTAQAIAYQHEAQVEGIRNLLTTLSQFPEVRGKDKRACAGIFRDILRQSPSSLNIGIADTMGNVIVSGVQPLPSRFGIADRKYFQDALRTKRFSVGEYAISRAVGKPTIHFALPVLDAAGSPIAVLYAALDLTPFNSLFDDQKLPPGSALNLTDHWGVVLYRYPLHETIKGGVSDRPDLRSRVAGPRDEGAFFGVGLDGVKRLLAFKRLRLHRDERPYLYIRVSIPKKAAMARVNGYIANSVAMFSAAVLIALVFTRLLAGRYLAVPIERLVKVSRAVESGDLSARTGLPYGGDELGLLAQSFDAMTESLDAGQRQRDAAVASLKASEERFHAIYDHLSDAVIIHDVETGAILDVNQAMCGMYGYSSDEACTMGVGAISQGTAPYTEKEAMAWMRLAAGGEPQLFEWLGRHRDGHSFWVEISMRRASIGGTDRLIVLARGISERKAAEEEKKSLMEQLHHAQRMESVGRLAGGIAHDFNNLLTPIIGFADIARREAPENSATVEKMERILRAAFRAKELVQQLLSFGRKQLLDMKITDLNAVVSSFAEILRRTIRESIDIRLRLAPEPGGICADKTHIEQILMNLFVNAQDATAGNGVISVETASVVLDEEYARHHAGVVPGRYVMLAVSDSGCGMERETLNHIFEPFFTTKNAGEGTGLGLATVYGIVRQHGGNVWVYSEPGRGTVFKLYFPMVEALPSLKDEEKSADLPAMGGAHGRILLVEDNEMVRTMLKDLLAGSGHDVIETGEPRQALQLAAGRAIDLLITDVIMPELNGPELYRQLLAAHPGLKVLFMSGYTDNVVVQHLGSAELSNFVQKPFTVQAMSARIAAILGEKNSG